MDYSSEVLQRFLSPRCAGEFALGTPGLVSGASEDRTLNAWVRFQIQLRDGVVHAVRFQVFGCPYTVAAAGWVADWFQGRPAAALGQLDVHAVRASLGIPLERLGKLLVIEDALEACRRGPEGGAGEAQGTKGS